MSGRLSGRLAFVTLPADAVDRQRSEALARALVAEGATVVLVADDAEAAGRLAAALGPGNAVFCPDDQVGQEGIGVDVGALVELAAELGGGRRPVGSED